MSICGVVCIVVFKLYRHDQKNKELCQVLLGGIGLKLGEWMTMTMLVSLKDEKKKKQVL
jgi:hypothetical protein